MLQKNIDNIELSYLTIEDYQELKEATEASYLGMENSYWPKSSIQKLIDIFPDGQIVIKIDGVIAGCALSIVVDYSQLDDNHTYADIITKSSFKNPKPEGYYFWWTNAQLSQSTRSIHT